MKKLFLLALAVLVVVSMASISFAQVAGSKHDMRTFTGSGVVPGGEICSVCHTPHNATVDADTPDLLWNHTLSSATYTMYDSSTMDTPTAAQTQPTGISKMCLGCHDGTIGIDNFGGLPQGQDVRVGAATGNADAQIGGAGSLADSHPISIEYPAPGLDGELRDRDDTVNTMGGSGILAAVLEGGVTLQCSTCHDVHNSIESEGPQFTRLDNTSNSALCVFCHDGK